MTDKYWFGPATGYHGGDPQLGDIEVPQRPFDAYSWDGVNWILDTKKDILNQIATLEQLQLQKLTPRSDREFRLIVAALLNQLTQPKIQELKKIDDDIKALRAQL